MNDTVAEAIAEELATITKVVDAPVAPFGYGRDLDCVTDITKNADMVDPFSILAVAQSCARRLITPRGQFIDDPNYGFDVRGMLNRGIPDAELRDLAGQIRTELLKDDRVSGAQVTVSFTSASELRIGAVIEPEDVQLGSFELTLALTSSAAVLEVIQ